MNKKIFLTKRSQSELLVLILSFMVIGSSVIVGTNFTLNSTNFTGNVILESQKTITESIMVEILANTSLEIKNGKVSLKLDDGSALAGKELEIYFGGILSSRQITNLDGNTYLNPNNASPGNISVKFLGDAFLYLNPSSLVIGDLIFEELNQTELNITNETLLNVTNISVGNCIEFEEQVFWSSGFTNDKKGSLNYEIWLPEYNCSSIGEETCFIKDIKTNSRLISTGVPDGELEGEGYVQISELSSSECNNPELEIYVEDLLRDKVIGEEVKKGKYCKNGKDEDCEIEEVSVTEEISNCYGIKIYGSQYLITDVFSVNYKLCGGVDEAS